MAWTFNEHTPVYLQIVGRIRNDILSGVYKPDDQIPPVRQLALTAAVNPNTMQRALTELEAEGLLYSKGTQGRFVTSDPDALAVVRKSAAKQLVSEFVKSAKHLAVSKDEIIKLIEEETDI